MILYNGAILPQENVRISHQDRGYYFGDGIYEVFRIYAGQLYEKQAHFRRLQRSAHEISLTLPYTLEEIESMLEKLLRREQVQDGSLYVQITRGIAPRSHYFPEGATPTLLAYCTEAKRPKEAMENGITAITSPDIRWLRCDIKTLNLLPNTLAKQHAADQAADETILHRDRIVTECSASNLMIVKDGEIRTHPANHFILHGITREVVLRLAADHDIPVSETAFNLQELFEADEVFITGTTVEITPIIRVDGGSIGTGNPGPVTRKLQEAFQQTIPVADTVEKQAGHKHQANTEIEAAADSDTSAGPGQDKPSEEESSS